MFCSLICQCRSIVVRAFQKLPTRIRRDRAKSKRGLREKPSGLGKLLVLQYNLLTRVPVNYGIRFSGPVTSLTARRVWYGVGTRSICQADPLAGYHLGGRKS